MSRRRGAIIRIDREYSWQILQGEVKRFSQDLRQLWVKIPKNNDRNIIRNSNLCRGNDSHESKKFSL